MTEQTTDAAAEAARPTSHDEATAIVRDDPALQKATDSEDAATDDDARTPDSAQAGETRD